MKLNAKHIGLVLVVAVAITGFMTTPEVSQGNPHKTPPSAVLVGLKGKLGPWQTNEGNVFREVADMVVAYASRSQNAPEIPNGYPAGELIAYMLANGYRYDILAHDKFLFVRP